MRRWVVILALCVGVGALGFSPQPASAALQWGADGGINDPDQNQDYPANSGGVAVVTGDSMNGVSISGGNADQMISNVTFALYLTMPNNQQASRLNLTPFTVTLDVNGEWHTEFALTQDSNQLGIGNYKAKITSEIFQFGISRKYFEHEHDFHVIP